MAFEGNDNWISRRTNNEWFTALLNQRERRKNKDIFVLWSGRIAVHILNTVENLKEVGKTLSKKIECDTYFLIDFNSG
jgi:hypothetical protein